MSGAGLHPSEGEMRTTRPTVIENGAPVGFSAAEIEGLLTTGAVFTSGAGVETI